MKAQLEKRSLGEGKKEGVRGKSFLEKTVSLVQNCGHREDSKESLRKVTRLGTCRLLKTFGKAACKE